MKKETKKMFNLNYSVKFSPNFRESIAYIWSHRLALAGVILSLVAVFLVGLQVRHYLSLQSHAGTETATTFFQPSSDSLTTTAKTFPVWINAASGVTFARLSLTFDPSKINLVSSPTIANTSLKDLGTPDEITDVSTANSVGKIVIVLGQIANTATPSGAFQALNLSFKATSNTSSTSSVAYNASDMQIVNPSAVEYTVASTPLNLTLNPTGSASLSFAGPTPANPQIIGTNFTVDLMMNTAGQNVSGVDTKVAFNRSMMDFVSVTPNSSSGFVSYPTSRYEAGTGTDTNGYVYFSANIGSGASPSPVNGSAVKIATLTLKPKTAVSGSGTQLSYVFTAGDRNDSNILATASSPTQDPTDILGSVTPISILINSASSPAPSASVSPSVTPSATPSPSPSPSVTPTPSPSPSPSASPRTITFSFVLQGKSRAEASKNTTLTISYLKDNQTTPTVVTATTNVAGQMNLSLPIGNYVFLVKAPGYLARRFGASSTPIAINSTTTSLDLSGAPLLGGDLNDDGVVNEVDYTSKYLTVFGTANILADLDGSGQVNTLDFGVMRPNWNLVNDTF